MPIWHSVLNVKAPTSAGEAFSVIVQPVVEPMDRFTALLKDLLFLLHGVAQRAEENRMSATNLGMMFCSHVLCPKTLSAEEIQAKHSIFTKATTFMIENPIKLFTVPEKLLLEIQSFLSRRQVIYF